MSAVWSSVGFFWAAVDVFEVAVEFSVGFEGFPAYLTLKPARFRSFDGFFMRGGFPMRFRNRFVLTCFFHKRSLQQYGWVRFHL